MYDNAIGGATTMTTDPKFNIDNDECDCDERCKDCGKKKKRDIRPYKPWINPYDIQNMING